MDIIPEDIERMARFLGREDPAIKRLLKAYVCDPKMRQTVRNLLKRRCTLAGFDPDDPPVFWPVRELPPGRLEVGHVIQGAKPGPQFTLPEEVVTQHLGAFGHNGTGKSYLAMHLALQAAREGFRVWVFDLEDEYSRLVPMLPDGELAVVEPEQLRFNMFQPPGDWVKPVNWLDELNLLLRGGTFLRDGSLNIFRVGMSKLLERKGITTGSTDWPSLVEVIEFFEAVKFGPKSRSAGYIESLLNRLVTLADIFEPTAAVSTSNMLQMLARRSVIFRLHNLVGIPLQTLVSFLLLWLARFREGSPEGTTHVVIIEEAHMLASKESRQDIGESILCRMFRTARKRGIALILCDQVPSELPPAVLANLACRVVMRLASASCIWSVQSSMGLDRKQAEAIAALELRRAVVHYTLHPTPFEIEVPQLSFPEKPEPSGLRYQTELILSKAQWSEYDKSSHKQTAAARLLSPDDLVGDALFVMRRICEAPIESIERRCHVLQIDRQKEGRARAELRDRGLIEKAELTVGRLKFFQPTDKGIAWAERRNIRIKKFKSGIVHEYILCQVERGIGRIGSKWRLQRNSSIASDQGLQPDLLVLGPDGLRIIVEVCCTNLDYDAKNIVLESAIAGVDMVIAVTPDKKTKNKLAEALRKNSQDGAGQSGHPIALLDSGQCLEDDFDWKEVVSEAREKLFPDG